MFEFGFLFCGCSLLVLGLLWLGLMADICVYLCFDELADLWVFWFGGMWV